jgi:hypothetical protein
LLIAAKLPETIRFHDPRHTAATHAGEAGMEEYVIAAMLGHRKGNVTRKYAKATIVQMPRTIIQVERLYSGKKPVKRRHIAYKLANKRPKMDKEKESV